MKYSRKLFIILNDIFNQISRKKDFDDAYVVKKRRISSLIIEVSIR